MGKKYAEGTSVLIESSRSEINRLLLKWECSKIAWSDEYDVGLASLRFLWKKDGQAFAALLQIKIPSDDEIRGWDECFWNNDPSSKRFMQSKFERLRDVRGQQEHRVLLIWLKACFNAVEIGIVKPEEIFLSFLQGTDGKTIGQLLLPHISRLLEGPTTRLLTVTESENQK